MQAKEKIYRVVDANLNRAREGMRVIEDFLRFLRDDKELSRKVRKLRHRITEAIKDSNLDWKDLLSARNTRADVGRDASSLKRAPQDYRATVAANIERAKEAMRALEEYSRVLEPKLGLEFKKIRFELYDLERDILRQYPLEHPLKSYLHGEVYVILDGALAGGDILKRAREVIDGGAKIIQLRDKEASTKQLMKKALKLRELTRKKKVLFIVNDRVDVALAVDADGVHLGQDDMGVSEARRLLGADKIIGLSVHNITQARRAGKCRVAYLALGPIFATKTKREAGKPLGIDIISCVKKEVCVPLVAVGGIGKKDIKGVSGNGADTVAVSSAILSAKDVKSATRGMVRELRRS